jgi:hypothetical protein
MVISLKSQQSPLPNEYNTMGIFWSKTTNLQLTAMLVNECELDNLGTISETLYKTIYFYFGRKSDNLAFKQNNELHNY